MSLVVAISTVADGSMFNRNNVVDSQVIDNRQRFLETNGITLDQTSRMRIDYDRTNFCDYMEVNESHRGKGMRAADIESADALITTDKNHALFLPIADCVGAVLFDPINQVLAVAHLGRHSLEQRGAYNIVAHLIKYYDSDPTQLQTWLSPAPSKESYPIWALDNKGMKEVTFEQLHAAGIIDKNITDNPTETDKDRNYYSYSEFLKGHPGNDGDYAVVAMIKD